MSKPLIACASLLLTALTLATPAAAHPDRDRAPVLRQRVEHQIVRASRQLDELARTGTMTPEQLARAQALRERVIEQTSGIFADERLTSADHRSLRTLKREARAFRRELRADLRTHRRRR